ncbi:MAG: hypothetical protein ACJ8CR_35655, partial [Roseiflexaceae bacterium]
SILWSSVSYILQIWIVIVFGAFSMFAPVILSIHPIAEIIIHISGANHVPWYYHPRDILFFRSGLKENILNDPLEDHLQLPNKKQKIYNTIGILINMIGLASASIYVTQLYK